MQKWPTPSFLNLAQYSSIMQTNLKCYWHDDFHEERAFVKVILLIQIFRHIVMGSTSSYQVTSYFLWAIFNEKSTQGTQINVWSFLRYLTLCNVVLSNKNRSNYWIGYVCYGVYSYFLRLDIHINILESRHGETLLSENSSRNQSHMSLPSLFKRGYDEAGG